MSAQEPDPTNPSYYKGTIVDQIIELFRLNFRLGNAVKSILRESGKDSDADLRKAIWYLTRELERRREVQENKLSPLAGLIADLHPPHLPDTQRTQEAPEPTPTPASQAALPITGWMRVGTTMRVRNPTVDPPVELGPGDEHYFIACDLSGGWVEQRKNTPP